MSRSQPDDRSRDYTRPDQPAGETLLDTVIEDARIGGTESERERSKDSIRELATEVVRGSLEIGRDVATTVNARIAVIDDLIGNVLNDILHHPAFQRLESGWRGLARLVDRTSPSDRIIIRFLNVTRRELESDEATSRLIALTAVETVCTFGGQPFSILIGDYEFGNTSVGILLTLAKIAARARAPFIAAVHLSQLGLSSFVEAPSAHRIRSALELDGAGWDAVRNSPYSRNLVLALPRFLVRNPYTRSLAASRYSHEEKVDGSDSSLLLWGSPIWIIAAQLARAFSRGSWCADVAMNERTSIDGSLPFFSGWSKADFLRQCGPLEISAGDSLILVLRNLGFTCLAQDGPAGRVVVSDITTARFDRAPEDPDTGRSIMLRDVLAACRIEQYLTFAAREARTWIETPDELREHLMRWVAEHSTSEGDLSAGMPDRAVFEGGRLRVVYDEERESGLVRIEGTLVANITPRRRSNLQVSTSALLHSPEHPRKEGWDSRPKALRTRPANTFPVGAPWVLPDATYHSFTKCLDLLERCALMKRRKLLEDHAFDEIQNLLLKKMAAAISARGDRGTSQQPQLLETPMEALDAGSVGGSAPYWAKYADRGIQEQVRTALASTSDVPVSAVDFANDIPRREVKIDFDSGDDSWDESRSGAGKKVSATDYATFFRVLGDVNALLFSVTLEGYARCAQPGEGLDADEVSQPLLIDGISKSSPGSLYGSAVAVVAQSLAQVFSIGHQIADWKLASVRVNEAKVELAKKELEFEDIKRHTAAKWAAGELDYEIETARKKAELEELKKKQDEATRERRKLMMEDLTQRYDLLTKALPVLSALPADMQADFKQELVLRLDSLNDTPLMIKSVQLAEPRE